MGGAAGREQPLVEQLELQFLNAAVHVCFSPDLTSVQVTY
jgi:hypothetical protein